MQIILSPKITEKSLSKAQEGCYTFEISPKANKIEVASEIKNLYNVKVKSVNVLIRKGEEKLRRGKFKIKGATRKYAVVLLEKGQKIPGFGIEEKKETKETKKETKEVKNAKN